MTVEQKLEEIMSGLAVVYRDGEIFPVSGFAKKDGDLWYALGARPYRIDPELEAEQPLKGLAFYRGKEGKDRRLELYFTNFDQVAEEPQAELAKRAVEGKELLQSEGGIERILERY